MSRYFGKKVLDKLNATKVDIWNLEVPVEINWAKRRKGWFSLKVPDMYSLMSKGIEEYEKGSFVVIDVQEDVLLEMIKADGDKSSKEKEQENVFVVVDDVDTELEQRKAVIIAGRGKVRLKDMSREERMKYENDVIDDETYWAISLIQECYFLTWTGLKEVKRECKKRHKVHNYVWIELKKRKSSGGCKGNMSAQERERLEEMSKDYERIYANCIKHGWWQEAMELEKGEYRLRKWKWSKEDFWKRWNEEKL